jgi:hypothetical protein
MENGNIEFTIDSLTIGVLALVFTSKGMGQNTGSKKAALLLMRLCNTNLCTSTANFRFDTPLLGEFNFNKKASGRSSN